MTLFALPSTHLETEGCHAVTRHRLLLCLQMMTTAMYGVPIVPAALADEKGNTVVVHTVASIHGLEHMLRPVRPSFAAPPPPCLFPILASCVFPYPFPYSPSLPYPPLLASDGPSSTLGLPHPFTVPPHRGFFH